MENFNITGDGRYLQMMGKIVDLHTNFSTDIDSPNPIFVCEMYKNQFTLAHKEGLFESTDLFKKMKELLYPMMGQNTSYIMEYEVRYGSKLIFESEDKLRTEQLISESWDFVKSKIYDQTIVIEGYWDDFKSGVSDVANKVGNAASSAWDATKSAASSAWDTAKENTAKSWEKIKTVGGQFLDKAVDATKQAASWVINKGLPWFFQTLEEFLISPVGIGLDIALTSIGVGKVATGILWGAILAWKVYLLATGKSDASSLMTYLDLAICAVGIGFSGAAKGLRVTVKAAGANIAKLGAKVLQPIFGVLSKGAGGLLKIMIKPLEWIASIFGPKASALITTFKTRIGGIFDSMQAAITKAAGSQAPSLTSTVGKGIRQDIINPAAAAIAGKGPVSLGKAAMKGTTAAAAFYGGEKLLHKGMETYGAEVSQGINKAKGALGMSTEPEKVDLGLDKAQYDFETSL